MSFYDDGLVGSKARSIEVEFNKIEIFSKRDLAVIFCIRKNYALQKRPQGIDGRDQMVL